MDPGNQGLVLRLPGPQRLYNDANQMLLTCRKQFVKVETSAAQPIRYHEVNREVESLTVTWLGWQFKTEKSAV